VTPVLLALLCLVAVAGRMVDAHGDVAGAARDAARAASTARSAAVVEGSAVAAAEQALEGENLDCQGGARVDLAGTGFRRGGQVSVVVSCDVDLRDLGFVLALGDPVRTIEARAVEVIDEFRGAQ